MARASEGTATFRLWCGNCVVFIESSELVWFPSTSWTLNERHLKAGELRDLSKHGKGFPNNLRAAAKPSWALPACSWRRLFVHCCCPDPLGDIQHLSSGCSNYRPFISEWDHSMVILLCPLCPISAQIPGLQSWRSIVVWSRFRKPTAKGTFRWWLQKESPTMCQWWLCPFTGLLGRGWEGRCPLEGGIWWTCQSNKNKK